MAIIADIAACYMSRVFSGCGDAIVTRTTSTDDLSMVHRVDWRPDIGRMTVFADIARLDVCEIFARSICAVVAINAVIRNISVVEICG